MVAPRPPVFFRDFTWVNRLLLGLALALLGFLGAHKLAQRNWQRQYWSTDACGEPGGRFAVLDGAFTTDADEYVPLFGGDPWVRTSTDSLYAGGSFFTYHAFPSDYDENAFRLPPRTLEVAWYSWRENRFYRGRFALPENRLDSLRAVYRALTDTTGWRFHRQPRDYDDQHEPSEPGFVLSVHLQEGGRLRLDALEAHGQHYAYPVPLAHYRAASYQPNWAAAGPATRYARSATAFRDTLLAHLDSTGRATLLALPRNKKAR